MKDYAKVINQSKEIHGQQQVRQTLAHSAVQKTKANTNKGTAPVKKGSGFFTVVAIFIIIAVLFAVYHQYAHHKAVLAAENAQANATGASGSGQAAQSQTSSPQFDFYTVLPNGGTPGATPSNSNTPSASNAPGVTTPAVTAPAANTTTATPTTATAPAVTTTPAATTSPPTTNTASMQYYLNAGEFSNEADAQQTLSQLLLLGVQANIKTFQQNGAPSYRVLVGPFEDQDTMNVVKQQLYAHQIQASVMQQ